jgi:signal transduction histidine kinase/DNA-binding NarL/FixJ family response regulator/HPt (histidine-containing phosphotransfer) domain-containing protein
LTHAPPVVAIEATKFAGNHGPQQIVFGAAGVALAVAVSVVIGWAADLPALKSVLPGAVEMKLNTALGLAAAALALMGLTRSFTGGVRPGRSTLLLATFVSLLGLLTLAQYAFGWNLRIDEALVLDKAGSFNVAKGRMSPYTAAALACLGFALMPPARARWVAACRAAALVALLIGVLSLIGYSWNAAELTTDTVLPPVAINTAIALVLLATGVLAAGTPFARAGGITRERVRSVEFKVLFGFVCAFVFLLFAAGLSYRASVDFANSAQWVSHTQEVRAALGGLKADVVDTALAQRNYLMTGQQAYRRTYVGAISKLKDDLPQLRVLVSDNPLQVSQLADLEVLMGRMYSAFAQTVALYDASGFQRAQVSVAAGGGMQAMGNVATQIDRMDAVEDQLLRSRQAASATSKRNMLVTALSAAAVALALFAFLFQSIRVQMQERQLAGRELLQAKKNADRARLDADAANRAKGSFLAAMSHEIRTPMNGVLGLLELLSLGDLSIEQRSTLAVVRQSGKSLLRIVDDILDFSKIEAGKLDLHPQPASVTEVIDRVRQVYSGMASSKGLLIKVDVDPRLGRAHSFDQFRLEQVLNNLVSNAIKFTERGSVLVSATLLARHERGEELSIAVQDTGIGIAADRLAVLFEPFAQAEAETSGRFGGTGLGLTICRSLAELMGGTAQISSTVGVGTTAVVTVRFPLADPAALPAGPSQPTLRELALLDRRQPPSVAEAEAEGTLLLVVDDHPTNRLVLKRQLNVLGYAAETAADGFQAVDIYLSRKLAGIITDCNMPQMNGYELARHIREHESRRGSPRIPILACTANAMPSEAARCIEAGMDDYLVKPAQLEDLLQRLDVWIPLKPLPGPSAPMPLLGIGGAARQPHEPGERPVSRRRKGVELDFALIDLVTAGDPDAERDLVADFRRSNDADLVAMAAAAQRSAWDKVGLHSHRIKGAAHTVGAHQLLRACRQLEEALASGDGDAVVARIGVVRESAGAVAAALAARLDRHQG